MRLKPWVHIFIDEATSEFVVYDWGQKHLWRLKGDTDLQELFRLLKDDITSQQLSERSGLPPSMIHAFVDRLLGLGILTNEPLSMDGLAEAFIPYTKTGRAVSNFVSLLQDARVVVIGLGGIGSWVSHMLAANEVGHLVLIDPDVVERKNLYRQAVYTLRDVGNAKVDVMSKLISSLSPATLVSNFRCKITQTDGLNDLLRQLPPITLLISCADEPSSTEVSRLISSVGFEHGIAHIVETGYTTAVGRLPQTVLPDRADGACPWCYPPTAQISLGRFIASGSGGRPLGPLSALMGQLVALEAIKVITNYEPPSLFNVRGEFNASTLELNTQHIARDPECTFCGRFPRGDRG